MEINQYPLESFAFQDDDFYDIDFWTGSGYQTKKILGSVIKAGILAAVENIYNADGSLNGNRSVNLDGNIVSFNSINAGEFNALISDSTTSTSTFNQSIAQIYLSIVDLLSPDKDVQFDINTTNTQLVLNDGLNFCSLQITNVGSALNFTDGITNYRVEANENGVIINTSYTLPNTDGTAGQVLTTDGAGVTSWQDGATTIVSWGDIVGTLADQTDLQAALDAKQEPITLTTTGTSGAATFDGTTLNVPDYSTTDTNIYNSDGTLIADRVVSMNNFGLTFNGAGDANGSQLNISSAANRAKGLNFQVGSGLRWKQQVSGAEIGGDNGSQLSMSYYDDAGVLKGTAFSISRTNGAFRLNNAYSLPTSGGTTGQVLTSTTLGLTEFQALPVEIQAAASDETTNLTIGTSKVTFRMPHAMTLTAVRASLSTAQAAGAIFTIDINQNGVSVLGTKLTIDNTEKTSTTAATPATIVTSSLTDDAEITIDIDQVGTALAKGLKITLIGTRA
jgi:hypothetical protein